MAEGECSFGLNFAEVEKIIAEYYDDIYRYCFWKVRNVADAQDLTQEVFLHFIEKIESYQDLGKPKALLYTIARNVCLNKLKKITELPYEEALDCDLISGDDTESTVINRIYLSNAVMTLPEMQREVLLLRYGQELHVSEIASILGISRFTVMYRLRNALTQLKKITKEAAHT